MQAFSLILISLFHCTYNSIRLSYSKLNELGDTMPKNNDLSTKQFLSDLRKEVKAFDNRINDAADYFNVKPSFLRNVLSSRELPGPRILSKMNLEPVKNIKYRYRPIEGES